MITENVSQLYSGEDDINSRIKELENEKESREQDIKATFRIHPYNHDLIDSIEDEIKDIVIEISDLRKQIERGE
jgi:ferredoxin-fold anticodon binding domain-containing protein